jgi:hypothetical protein
MDLTVDLVPHIGQQNHPLVGEHDVVFDQYSIMVGGGQFTAATGRKRMEIGLVCKAPGSPINFLNASNRFPVAVLDVIAKVVEQKLAEMNGEAPAAADASSSDQPAGKTPAKPRRTHRPMPEALAQKAAAQHQASISDTAGSEQNL